ncbi:hypothetical protein JVT61DRAFT_8732 [Boletus reticuloceps]|uniref:Uncharacterized protein n=1 Tax=Boletus reticuloceps TaxID=495285 RepID=A0A8I3A5M5_9AGAM|nr:hypothetical protein JVT61DRAFT_8732 [Boletus reticuloceps]
MAWALDELPLTQSTESLLGRLCRPSEKVQAMIEEHEQAKQTSEERACMKAKHREELTFKCEQAGKAAEQDLTKASTKKVRGSAPTTTTQTPVVLLPDNAVNFFCQVTSLQPCAN